jgi:osmotically-inducible protein OsmY
VIPLSDGIPARRFPVVNVALIAANFAVWIFYELPHLGSSIAPASFYPCSLSGACHAPEPWDVGWFTAMFMHGSWDHILGNMLFLAIFGKNNELRVRLMGVDGRADADTEAAVIDALADAHLLDGDDADVEARDGTVTLRRSVRLESERDAVERVARAVPGVERVVSHLDVWLVLSPDDVLVRVHDAILALDRIGVQIVDNDVTLTGTVSSPAHRDAALGAAAGTPGVANVHDELAVCSAAA